MKKAFKIAGKIVWLAAKVYLVWNTLCWAFVGFGRYLHHVTVGTIDPDKTLVENVMDKLYAVIDEACDYVAEYYNRIKTKTAIE